MDEIKKIIEDRLKKLPQEVVNSLNEIDWINELLKISHENNFNQEQENSFITESTIAILGIEESEKYPENLSENVGLEDDIVIKIAKEVNEKILSPLNEKILSSKKDLIKESSEKIDWQNRVDEISKKYNLNDSQKNALNSICKDILSNMGKKGELLSSLDQKLSISKLLSEQIIDDLNKRIFDYTLKNIETKPVSKIPEVKPVNLPTIQTNTPTSYNNSPKISTPKYMPTGLNSYKPAGLGKENIEIKKEPLIEGDSRIQYKPVSSVQSPQNTTTEPVQKPKEVPRFNASLDEVKPQTITPGPSSIMDSKLNTVTVGTKEDVKQEIKENPIVKQYTVDPYREPLA